MNAKNAKIANRVRTAVTLLVSGILLFVIFVSRDHITHTAYLIGIRGYQAETLFILVDIVALVGKVLSLKYFARSTRRIGMRLTIAAGTLSLICNVAAGANWGQRGYGVFIVGLFVTLEQVVMRIKPAAGVTAANNRRAANTATTLVTVPAGQPTLTVVTRRKCDAGCTCKRHNRTARKVAA